MMLTKQLNGLLGYLIAGKVASSEQAMGWLRAEMYRICSGLMPAVKIKIMAVLCRCATELSGRAVRFARSHELIFYITSLRNINVATSIEACLYGARNRLQSPCHTGKF